MPDAGPDFRTHVEENLEVLDGMPEREILVHGDRRVTAGEFTVLVRRMARALAARGVQRSETVTLLSGNLPETLAARYAANLVGCQVNHLYNKLAADAQAAIVQDVETRALIVDPRLSGRAAGITRSVPVKDVLFLGPGEGEDLLELAAEQSGEPFVSPAGPDDVCSIRHTGGTTGHPKGICSTFGTMSRIFRSRPGELAKSSRQLVCTTLAHAAGMLADATLGSGGTVVLLEDFDPAEVLATIERERITHLFLLPPMLYRMLDDPSCRTADTSSLEGLVYGGCQASPARLVDAVHRFGPVLHQFYGQNEAGGISFLRPEEHDPQRPELMRTAGRVQEGVEVEIRDESGRAVPTGGTGEICVRSPQVMDGYWKQPELTAEVMQDGWVRTGDLGHFDEDGYLTVDDRIKDMIVVVGGHVYTTELEDLLNSHPGVAQSAVFGVRDADRMERVHAAVVPAPYGEVDADELRAWVRASRGPMYEPAHVRFMDELPLTDAGKPDKKLLRTQEAPAAV